MIDVINWKIIKALQENARISYADLGKKVHLSAPAVAERVRKMEESGLIKGFSVKVDLDKVGFPIVALVQCHIFRTKELEFKELVLSFPEVIECYNVTGEQAFIIKIAVQSMSDLDRILDDFCTLSDTNTMVVLSTPIHRSMPDIKLT